jgi:hypothetical protein
MIGRDVEQAADAWLDLVANRPARFHALSAAVPRCLSSAVVPRPGPGRRRAGRCLPGPDQAVVVGDAHPDAFALLGLPVRGVVYAGALDDTDREAVLAHERAVTVCGNRTQVARAVGKAALPPSLSTTRRSLPAAVLALLGFPRRSPLHDAGPAPRRVAPSAPTPAPILSRSTIPCSP